MTKINKNKQVRTDHGEFAFYEPSQTLVFSHQLSESLCFVVHLMRPAFSGRFWTFIKFHSPPLSHFFYLSLCLSSLIQFIISLPGADFSFKMPISFRFFFSGFPHFFKFFVFPSFYVRNDNFKTNKRDIRLSFHAFLLSKHEWKVCFPFDLTPTNAQ